MALTSAYLIWAGGYPGSRAAGTRYLFVHMVGGSTLLAGVLWHLGTGGSLDFSLFEGSVAGWLVLGGFAITPRSFRCTHGLPMPIRRPESPAACS